MSTAAPPARVERRALLVWGVGLVAYVVAVLQRTSLGVAGIAAADRFDASASVLATFAVLQLLVYAGLQVPVGVLLDRYGARRLILLGALTAGAGQVLLADTTSLPGAISARVLVGAGDAMTFVCVLRLVAAWFPPRRNPLMTQLTGLTGQLGQIASAVPLAHLLGAYGWTTTYLSAATASGVAFVLVLLLLHDAPPGAVSPRRASTLAEVRTQVAQAFLHPGTRLGLWTHFTVQYSGTVFVLLWATRSWSRARGSRPLRRAPF